MARYLDPLTKSDKLSGSNITQTARYHIVLREILLDTFRKLLDKARERHPRPERRQYATGVVVSVVHASLINKRSSHHQFTFALDQQNPPPAAGKLAGQESAIESTPYYERIVVSIDVPGTH